MSLISLFPEPPPEYLCKLLGHDFLRLRPADVRAMMFTPPYAPFMRIGFCKRCSKPLLQPNQSLEDERNV